MEAHGAPSLISGGGPKRPPPAFSWDFETSPLIGLIYIFPPNLLIKKWEKKGKQMQHSKPSKLVNSVSRKLVPGIHCNPSKPSKQVNQS